MSAECCVDASEVVCGRVPHCDPSDVVMASAHHLYTLLVVVMYVCRDAGVRVTYEVVVT